MARVSALPGRFDVACMGDASWNLAEATPGDDRPRFRPGGGAVRAAALLARSGFSVGLATNLQDDLMGRKLHARLDAAGVDTRAVSFERSFAPLLSLETTADHQRIVRSNLAQLPIFPPEGWGGRVLLLSGLSPAVAYNASLCKAARAARRQKSIVVVEIAAAWYLWAGADPRSLRAILGEADIVRATAEDFAILGITQQTLLAWMRDDSVLVSSDLAEQPTATGRFGAVTPRLTGLPKGYGASVAAAICAELAARDGDIEQKPAELFRRAFARTALACTH